MHFVVLECRLRLGNQERLNILQARLELLLEHHQLVYQLKDRLFRLYVHVLLHQLLQFDPTENQEVPRQVG
jgi:hypothetical protein